MANTRKKTLRLEVKLSPHLDDTLIVNYKDLVEKALAASDDAEDTPPVSPHPSTKYETKTFPDLRRKNQAWNFPDFRFVADGYEQDSFIDDSEMFEESVTDSVKDLGYQIRSNSESIDSDMDSESETLSGCSSLSGSNSDTASVMEIEKYEKTTTQRSENVSSKKNPEDKQCLEILKVFTLNMDLFGGRPVTISRPPSRGMEVDSFGDPVVLLPRLASPAKRRHEEEEKQDQTRVAEHGTNNCNVVRSVSSRAIVMVDLCNSPQKERSECGVSSSPVAADLSDTPASPVSSSPVAPARGQATRTPIISPFAIPSTDVCCSLAPESYASSTKKREPSCIICKVESTRANPKHQSSKASQTPPVRLSEPAMKVGAIKRPASSKVVNPAKAKQSQRTDSSKRSTMPRMPKLSADMVALVDAVITNRSAEEKSRCESSDDRLLRLGEACKSLAPIDRMLVYEKVANHWRTSPRKVSRRLSRLRATSDKQPVKDSLSRLHLLLVTESKQVKGLHVNRMLSPASVELVSGALGAQLQWLERHPPRKGTLTDALESFARGELLALWASGGPGVAAYGPHAHELASVAIEREFRRITARWRHA